MVFVDISGFTKLSERLATHGREGAEQVTDAIEGCFTALLSVAYANGGGLIKFGGDALLLLFDGEGHVARAARSAVWMRRMLREVGRVELPGARLQLRMSVGMHSGRFALFLVGRSHRELLATGPAWTRTVEMEHAAEAGEILVSPESAALLPVRCIGRQKGPGHLLVREPRDVLPIVDTAVDERIPEGTARCLSVAVREHVLAGGGAPEHRPVTVAFVRFEGTDGMLRSKGTVTTSLALEEMVEQVQDAVDHHGVCFLGSDVDADGGKIILTAGAPSVTGNDEERMLLALRRIVGAQIRIPLRIGANRGAVFAGDIGPAYRRTYTVMGDAVNLAARLMAKARPGEVYATADVLDRSTTRFDVAELEPFSVKGKARPVQAWSVGAAVGGRHRERAAERYPLAGRERELEVLVGALDAAARGRGRLIEIVGEPGIGKTRMLEELRERAGEIRMLHATAEAYTSSTPYAVWRELLREILGVGWEDPDDAVIERLYPTVEADPELLPWLPLLAGVLDVDMAPTLEVEMLAPEFVRPRINQTVGRFLGDLLDTTTLIEIEDAHFMDPASADLLAALADGLTERPWLALVTRRETDSGFVASPGPLVESLRPGPLTQDQAITLAGAATEATPLLPHDLQMVADRSAGNPQFLLDLVRARASGSMLPDSVEAAAMVQIDQLAPEDRVVVRRASVLGLSFHPRSVVDLFEEGERMPDGATWVRLSGLLEEDGQGYLRFRRAIVRDAAYAGLPFRTRRRLHAMAGARLEREMGEEVDEAAGILSLHSFMAEEHQKAWRYARVAGERAGRLFANEEAVRLYRRAVEAGRRAGVSADELFPVVEALGDVARRAGLFEVAARAYSDARRLSAGDALRQAGLMYKRGLLEESAGRFPRALRALGRGRGLVAAAPPAEGARLAARLGARYANVLRMQGRMLEASRWARRAIVEAEAADAREALAEAVSSLAVADIVLGRPEAEEHLRRAEQIFVEIGDLVGQAIVVGNLGALAYFRGRWDDALASYERARNLFSNVGDPVRAASMGMNVGEVLVDQGRVGEADVVLRDVARVFLASGDRHTYGLCLAFLGRSAIRAGRLDDAIALLEQARTELREAGAHGDALEVEAREAEISLFTGEPERALAASSALLSRSTLEEDVGHVTPILHRVRGYALAQLGRWGEARTALEASLAAARDKEADYEVALTLQALIRLSASEGQAPPGAADECASILRGLSVAAVPAPPLRRARLD